MGENSGLACRPEVPVAGAGATPSVDSGQSPIRRLASVGAGHAGCVGSLIDRLPSWIEPPATDDLRDVESRGALAETEAVTGRWGHERLIGCRAVEPCH